MRHPSLWTARSRHVRDFTDDVAEAESYKAVVIPAMNALRTAVDSMEEITSSEYWLLPSYGEILSGVR